MPISPVTNIESRHRPASLNLALKQKNLNSTK